ncbi:hypothetical protein [Propioniferax innocua]|uniref:Protocatechuate 4,5-dioxygenase beta chain/2,3-dihydroxyphenylpropionate 1,2-dioxygenase n=1 Tax=Propioniferax innocua TaxID=1753 RepID=A0A542ZCA2_9ACTN|nr:hypothetical protein [Propioniferax innocua]TQL57982.1 protocatechuate 4,5-dioxygenase beta chain/2,3-dihydroxyphenylpropionate 1,2-dioxygenase [Propioniferax innocua]
MADIVMAYSSAHAPMMSANPESAQPEMAERFFAGLHEAESRALALEPQAVVMVSGEHFTNFFLDNLPQVSVGLGETHLGPVEKWLGIDRVQVPGAPELAEHILAGTIARGHMPGLSHDLTVDHGFMTVYHSLSPDASLPLVPMIMNCTYEPLMTLRHCWNFGIALGQAIRAHDGLERVLLVGAGGPSHFVGEPRVGDIDIDFDLWFLRRLEQGCPPDLLDIGNEELMLAGNGTGEIRAWVTVAGAMSPEAGAPPITTTAVAYEPIHEWINGMGVAVHEVDGTIGDGPATSIFSADGRQGGTR